MLIKTSELTGTALDWAVAKCEGYTLRIPAFATRPWLQIVTPGGEFPCPKFSTDWAQAGPLVEREKLCVGYKHQCDPSYAELLDTNTLCWARTTAGGYLKHGPTPLIAAMRCFVASRLGDEIAIPEELCA